MPRLRADRKDPGGLGGQKGSNQELANLIFKMLRNNVRVGLNSLELVQPLNYVKAMPTYRVAHSRFNCLKAFGRLGRRIQFQAHPFDGTL